MDRNFCTDRAGNSFMRMPNSTVYIHFGECIIMLYLIGRYLCDYFMDKSPCACGVCGQGCCTVFYTGAWFLIP